MKVNNDNFNIVLCSIESDNDNYLDVFDTICCEVNKLTRFRIAILYSLISEEPINSITLKGKIVYFGNGTIEKMVYQDIMEEKLHLDSENCESSALEPISVKNIDLKMPEGVANGYGGVFNINYSVSFPEYGLYQIELYYRKNDESEYTFAGVAPLTVCENKSIM